MGRRGDEAVAAARALIGVRFRPQGRTRETGLDCVGLAAAALQVDAPRDYPLRGGSAERTAEMLAAAGLRRADVLRAGDLVLVAAGPAQLHLGIFTGTGLVHSDAGLRRVVERPGPLPWPIIHIWRAED